MMFLRIIPLKVYLIVAVLLVATTVGYLMTQHIKTIGQQELQIEKLEESLQTRKRIDAAIRNAPTTRDESVRVLNDFLSSRD
jgi:predicted Holliday junction resolvase-like endonuclease